MQDYKSWSDQQISTEVAIRVNFTRLLPARLLGRNLHKLTLEDFDPCNSTADAWPIIVENKISIIYNWQSGEYPTARGIRITQRTGGKFFDPIEITIPNPLRSAMIVFLMMTEEGL